MGRPVISSLWRLTLEESMGPAVDCITRFCVKKQKEKKNK
jgi:hypothetical protein